MGKCMMIGGKPCPRTSDENAKQFCPAWTRYVETNIESGEDRIAEECLFQAMPKFMIETLKASNRPAAAVESMRNETCNQLSEGFRTIGNLMGELHQDVSNRLPPPKREG